MARARSRSSRQGDDEADQLVSELQGDSVAVEAQQPMDEAAAAGADDIVDAPYGAKVGTRTIRPPGIPPQPREQTFVSGVNRGAHLNLYLSTALHAMARAWLNGAKVRWQLKGGRPDVIRLSAATQKAYTLRTHGQQRPHFCIPTGSVGRAASSFETMPVESWVDGDEICIRIPPNAFPDGNG
jgi:hypothetical protein